MMFRSLVKLVPAVSLASLAACMSAGLGDDQTAGQTDGQDVSSTQYVDIMDFAKTDQGQWYDTIGKLDAEFNDVCGDTFCEGDYANITPLTFACSVSSKEGVVHDCAWTFSASNVGVDPKTAAIDIDAPTFVCHVKTKTTSVKLIAALAGSSDALHLALPDGSPSIYDQIGDCLQHPTGATPFTLNPGTTYVAATDYYATDANRAKWSATQAGLLDGFNRICGDTYCSSDYGDLQSMQFECSVTKSSGNVKSCEWVFGGSYHTIGGSGSLDAVDKTFRCPVPVKGTLSQLIAALTAPGVDAIQVTLPGETTSAYDAIGNNCLP